MSTPTDNDESRPSASALDFDLNYREPEKREATVTRQAIPPPPNQAWAPQGPVGVAVQPQQTQAPAAKSTFASTLGSAIFFFVMESIVFGKPFAFAFTAMIAMHECGHALMIKRYRRTYGGMYFMPFVGAVVRYSNRGAGENLFEDAMISIAGPVAGGLGGLLFTALYLYSHQPLFLLLARMTFAINLVNLVPARPLDGSKILPAIFAPDARLAKSDRQRVGAMYFGLCAVLLVAFILTLLR